MRPDIVSGAVFPDYALADHRGSYWFFGRPTVEELRLDLRAVLQRCRPDWDIASAEQRAARARGDKTAFYPYGKTKAQVLAEQD